MDIVADLMKQVATGENLSMIAKSVGGDNKAVQSALSMGFPMVMGSLANTASKPGGADMLRIVLAKAGGSNPLDNMGGFLSNPAGAGGAAMMTALFGSQMSGIQTAISQKTGLPPEIVSKVMAIATPMVMGYVGKMFVSQKMDAAGLTSLLTDQSKMALAGSPDAAAMAQQLLGTQAGSGGISGILKKFIVK
jgi:OOP family OmpA-OmpF porin